MKRIIWTVVVTILVIVAIPLVVLATGAVDVGATSDPGSLEMLLADYAVDRSVAVRAPDQQNPFRGDSEAIDSGLHHYGTMCVRCHGGPGVEPERFAHGLNPAAPDLQRVIEEFTSAELFWITRNGIRMTGMPAFGITHSDDELWKIVAFLEVLPELSAEQRQALSTAASGGSGSGHHDAGSGHESSSGSSSRQQPSLSGQDTHSQSSPAAGGHNHSDSGQAASTDTN